MLEVLERINSPADVKKLKGEELDKLSEDVRQAVINKVSQTGGHIGPNLGIVETTVALHYVFDSPKDKFVFDVSHQCYPHKILTGRKEAYINPKGDYHVTGFTNPNESEHDMFTIGHTSTALSLATGLAKARDVKGTKENIIAIVGDGSLGGGEALEALNNAPELGSNIIVIVNDNKMSICENHGTLYKHLQDLRESNGEAANNIFKALGYEYHYVGDGNNVHAVIAALEQVKDADHAVLLHISTLKGKGLPYAEANPANWHAGGPFDVATGKPLYPGSKEESYGSIFENFMRDKLANDERLVAITPATPWNTGMAEDMRNNSHYVDVGINEEHAVAFASGIAKNGGRPVLGLSAAFAQRTYDQLSSDLALNNSPALLVIQGGGLNAGGNTHLGCFDIPMMANIPGLVYVAPASAEELKDVLEYGYMQDKYPYLVRMPRGKVVHDAAYKKRDLSKLGEFEVVNKGSKVAIIALGTFFNLGKEVCAALKEQGIEATLINPLYITHYDYKLLEDLKKDHDVVVSIEDGVLEGGFGEKIARFYGDSTMKVLCYGGEKMFYDEMSYDEQYEKYHLRSDLMSADIVEALKK